MTSAVLAGLVVPWLALCLLVGYVARERGRGAVALFGLSVVLSPLVGFLVAVGLPARERPATTALGRAARAPLDPVLTFCYVVIAFGVGVLVWLAVWRP